jgi:site-specific recombinase XerD
VAGGVELLAVDRADVEAYARDLEQAGRARSTVARRLATLAWFYRYAVEEAALPRSPVAHVRRPSVARDSQKLGLDRDEAARFLAAAETALSAASFMASARRPAAGLPPGTPPERQGTVPRAFSLALLDSIPDRRRAIRG